MQTTRERNSLGILGIIRFFFANNEREKEREREVNH